MPAKVLWHPEGLTAGLHKAFAQSAGDAKVAALARNPAPGHIGVSYRLTGPETAWLRGTGRLAHIFEGGRQGGYPIQPGLRTTTRAGKTGVGRVTAGGAKSTNVAIKFTKGDGSFYRGPGFLGGPMTAQPFIHPAGQAWAHGLYQRRAAAACRAFGGAAASGFGLF